MHDRDGDKILIEPGFGGGIYAYTLSDNTVASVGLDADNVEEFITEIRNAIKENK